jgi:DNA invertase Pin-like site-specific DNA recombinase
MIVALYGRVSTSDQSCAAQLLELREYCAQKKWTIAHEFTDTISGTKADRVGLNSVMELVRAKKIDAVCAVKIDRMARSMQHFCNLAAEFVKHDVALICTSQGIDTSNSNPCGKFQLNILAAVAAFERDLISERTKAGLAVARANGKILGRPSPKMPPTTRVRQEIVRQWVEDGRGSYEELGIRLGGVSRSTAWRLAKKIIPTLPPPAVEIEV